METFLTILKIIFLVCAIPASFKNIVDACRGFGIKRSSVWFMSISIVGFIAIHFNWINL